MRLADLGETALIGRIRRRLALHAAPDPAVLLGIGDDAALLAPPQAPIVATTDMLVEGVHFLLANMAPRDLGHKALAVNLSDIAAMGGRPRFALVSLALPGSLPVDFVEAFYEGLGALAAATGTSVVGGDTTGSPGPVVVDVALLGEVLPGGPFRGDAARPGDVLWLTGRLGGAAAGLLWSQGRGGGIGEQQAAGAWQAHARPAPRLAEAAALAALTAKTIPAAAPGGRRGARDLSDGLAAAALLLAEASGVAVELEAAALPVHPAAVAVARAAGLDPLDLALYGGEDYELLFTAGEGEASQVAAALGAPGLAGAVPIGRCADGQGVSLLLPDGQRRPVTGRGYDHFAQEGVGGR